MDKPDDHDLLQVATAISDGAAVDWARLPQPPDHPQSTAVLREMAVLDRITKSAPEEHNKVEQALEDWRERAVEAMLDAYHQSLTDPRLWPADRGQADAPLAFFLLEKAFYEIEYELAHRPDWLRVPLAGTCRILERLEAAAS